MIIIGAYYLYEKKTHILGYKCVNLVTNTDIKIELRYAK